MKKFVFSFFQEHVQVFIEPFKAADPWVKIKVVCNHKIFIDAFKSATVLAESFDGVCYRGRANNPDFFRLMFSGYVNQPL